MKCFTCYTTDVIFSVISLQRYISVISPPCFYQISEPSGKTNLPFSAAGRIWENKAFILKRSSLWSSQCWRKSHSNITTTIFSNPCVIKYTPKLSIKQQFHFYSKIIANLVCDKKAHRDQTHMPENGNMRKFCKVKLKEFKVYNI